jgi:hypothetical protein
VPGDDDLALKRWFVEHGGEASNADALKVCDVGPPPDGKRATAKAVRAPAGKPKLVTPADPPG